MRVADKNFGKSSNKGKSSLKSFKIKGFRLFILLCEIHMRLKFETLSIYSTKENLVEILVGLCYYFFGTTKMVGG